MKKGFTLIELLAVITILGVLGLLITPLISKQVSKSNDELYEAQIENIKNGAKNWSTDNIDILPETEGQSVSVTLKELEEKGYVDKNLKNPKTNKEFDVNKKVIIRYENGNYKYILDEFN